MQLKWKISTSLIISLMIIAENIDITRQISQESSIKRINNSIDDFPYFSFSSDSLILNNYKHDIHTLPKDFFHSFKFIKFLELSNNNFEKFANGTFDNLRELKFLNISKNKLIELPNGIFDDLITLKYFNLASNNLTELPTGIFDRNTNLTLLSISANRFKFLPVGLFKNNKKLQIVKIRYVKELTNLPSEFFANLTDLRRVNISYCSLKNLSANIFRGSINLQDIQIRYNDLQSLPEGIFDDLKNLEILQLDGNKIGSLPDNIFKSCAKLKELYLINNGIYKISRFTFNGLQSLNKLFMQNNELVTIEENAFANLQNVTQMNLAKNYISHFAETEIENEITLAFINCENLIELDLSFNKISTLSSEWFQISQIRYLNLSNNLLSSLTTVDFDLEQNNSIIIDVSHNSITRIHFDNSDINFDVEFERNITLFLNGNPIECGDALYDLLRYLDGTMTEKVREKLFIEIGPMKCPVSKEYGGKLLSEINSKDYKSIPLRENVVNYDLCPKECDIRKRQSNKTFIVDCSFRNLTKIPNTLCYSNEEGYHNLLDLSGNMISDLSKPPPNGYYHFRKVLLSHNQIKELFYSFFTGPELRLVKLDNNQISMIKYHIVRYFMSKNIYLTLGNNPFKCDCGNNNLRRVTEFLSDTFILDSDDIICENTNLPMKSYSEFCEINNTEVLLFISASVALLGLIFAALTIFYCLNTEKIKVWLYAHKIFVWLVTEVDLDKDKIYDAFISYSHKDEVFVINELIKNLEMGTRSFKLCIHFRDWPAGEWIPQQINRSILQSRRTIFVISTNFINSEWAKMEFRAAHKKAIKEGRSRIIVVLYGDIGPIDHLEPDLKSYLKMNTYVKWGDPWFWDKLRYALPHKYDFRNSRTQT